METKQHTIAGKGHCSHRLYRTPVLSSHRDSSTNEAARCCRPRMFLQISGRERWSTTRAIKWRIKFSDLRFQPNLARLRTNPCSSLASRWLDIRPASVWFPSLASDSVAKGKRCDDNSSMIRDRIKQWPCLSLCALCCSLVWSLL